MITVFSDSLTSVGCDERVVHMWCWRSRIRPETAHARMRSHSHEEKAMTASWKCERVICSSCIPSPGVTTCVISSRPKKCERCVPSHYVSKKIHLYKVRNMTDAADATRIQEKLLGNPIFSISYASHKDRLHYNAISTAARLLRTDAPNIHKFFKTLEQWSLVSENYAQQIADGGSNDIRAHACTEMKSFRDSAISVFPGFTGELRSKIENTIATLNKDLEMFCEAMVTPPHTSARVRLAVEQRGMFYASRAILL